VTLPQVVDMFFHLRGYESVGSVHVHFLEWFFYHVWAL